MKKFFLDAKNIFFDKDLDFRVRLFNILALAGIIIGISSTISCLRTGEGFTSLLINFSSIPVSFFLMYFASKSGRYQLCYTLTIIIVFLIIFPAIFLTGGAYYSGMPSFFVFAVVFTVFMLDGKKALLISAFEILLYVAICIYAFHYPDKVHFIPGEGAQLQDIISGFVMASIALGITMHAQFRMYRKQQKLLEEARERALQLSDAKSMFLANMSHEIRTPINVILGLNEMILRESDSQRISKHGAGINTAGNTLLNLVNDVLDVSKIESGKMDLLNETYQTRNLINDLTRIGEERASKRNLKLLVEEKGNISKLLYGDCIHIRQIVINFISNAAKYTEKGSIKLSFSEKKSDDQDMIFLCISVEDTGIGIKKEDFSQLFDAFTRIDLSSHRNIEGTGLGLSIAKELAELMDGKIYVQSEPGKGSKFSLEVPQKLVSMGLLDSEDCRIKERDQGSYNVLAPDARILIVDDNKENLYVIQSILERTMINIDTADSGVECLKLVSKQRYDLVFMDYMMPEMDGLETFKRLKTDIKGFDTPVIALTAATLSDVKDMLLAAGFSAYLTKPIMYQKLEQALLEWLPRDLLIESKNETEIFQVTDEFKAELKLKLAQYGIEPEIGLRYLSGDIKQYMKLSAFFLESYQENLKTSKTAIEKNDFENLKLSMHSLKSRSLAVGASELSKTAESIERHCFLNDREYLNVSMPLLYLELERTVHGLKVFLSDMENYISDKDMKQDKNGINHESFLYELLSHIRKCQYKATKEYLDQSPEYLISPELREELYKTLESLDFEEAEKIIYSYLDETEGEFGAV